MPTHIFTCTKTHTRSTNPFTHTLLVKVFSALTDKLWVKNNNNNNISHRASEAPAAEECQPAITRRLPVISYYLKQGGEAFIQGILKNQIVLSAGLKT